MLRANVGLSRKLSKDYNSTGYSINLDGEITAPVSDPEAITEQVKELFDLAEEALNQQVERAEGESAIANRDVQRENGSAKQSEDRNGSSNGHAANGTSERDQRNGHREDAPATNKQIGYLLNIGKRQQLTTAELEARVADILGRPVGLYDLTKKSAGTVIDILTNARTETTAASRS